MSPGSLGFIHLNPISSLKTSPSVTYLLQSRRAWTAHASLARVSNLPATVLARTSCATHLATSGHQPTLLKKRHHAMTRSHGYGGRGAPFACSRPSTKTSQNGSYHRLRTNQKLRSSWPPTWPARARCSAGLALNAHPPSPRRFRGGLPHLRPPEPRAHLVAVATAPSLSAAARGSSLERFVPRPLRSPRCADADACARRAATRRPPVREHPGVPGLSGSLLIPRSRRSQGGPRAPRCAQHSVPPGPLGACTGLVRDL